MFLLHDSGVGDPGPILVLPTEQGRLTIGSLMPHFVVSPNIFPKFIQYTLCVMGELKHKQLTITVFREIEGHLSGHVPIDILFDFEKAAMNSVGNLFIGVAVTGCVFHLWQNIWKEYKTMDCSSGASMIQKCTTGVLRP